MRRKSEKGFMLLETLVVTVFIATLFAFIYQNTIPLFGEYKQRMKYDDIDSVYAADLFRQMLLADYNYNDLVSGLGNDPTNIYKDITDCRKNVAGFNYENDDLCEALEESLNISAVYLTHYDTNLLNRWRKMTKYSRSILIAVLKRISIICLLILRIRQRLINIA